jgi:hypothetical protein
MVKKYITRKIKKTNGLIYCHYCRTDLRPNNYYFHKTELNHDVKIYEHDPRDKRFNIRLLKGKYEPL